MNDWTDHCTIGITTRDRAADLQHTIQRQNAIGLGEMRYIIVDDGSADADAQRSVAAQLPRCRYVRHEQSLGLVRSRDEMADLCETEFLISLDDDSYFVDLAGMAKAFRELVKEPRLGLLSFCIIQLKPYERRRTQFPAGELWWFRGCGYLLRVSAFRNVGGYPSEFQYGGEETHLMMQFYRAGYIMLHCPEVVVEHRWSGGARDQKMMEYHFTRGQALVKLLNEPLLMASAGVVILLLKRLWNNPGFAVCHFKGWLSGICAGVLARPQCQHLTLRQYRALRVKVLESGIPENVELAIHENRS